MPDLATIREVMQELGRRRWIGRSEAEKLAHSQMMLAARLRKARKQKRATKAKA